MYIVALVELSCCLFMFGLISFVQLVHYPLFNLVPESSFVDYEKSHQFRISFIVIPVMLSELLSAFFLFLYLESNYIRLSSFMLLGVIWISTCAIQSPLHSRLARRFDKRNISKLCSSNWIRTVSWASRSILLLILYLPAEVRI